MVFYPVFAAFVWASYLAINKYLFVLVYLFNFPNPTELRPPLPAYEIISFGSPIRSGFAKRDITPKHWQWVAGFMPPHPGLSVKDRLWAKSLALQDSEGNVVVIVSVDVIGLLPDEIKKVVGIVGIPQENIFLSTTHTHSGPDTMGLWIWKNKKYMNFLRTQISGAINESVGNLQPSAIRFGKKQFPGYAHGRDGNPADSEVAVLQVLFDGNPITLVNFACHADAVMGLQFSADFPYFLGERIKRRAGGEVMFIPGAIGGVQPAFDRQSQFHFVKTLGEDLADAALTAIQEPIIPERVSLSAKKIKIKAPFENSGLLSKAYRFGMVNDLLRDGNVHVEVGKITIGSAEILTVPGELFPKIWWRVKERMKGNPNMIFGLTGGEFGYILSPEDVQSGKHKYHVSVSVGPTFGEEIGRGLKQLATE